MRARGLGIVSAVVVLAVGLLTPLPAASAAEPLRVLLLGDSVLQGSAGDYTWRYRMWQALTSAGVEVDLLGPRTDLLDPATWDVGSYAYADPDFDRDHGGAWGTSLAFPYKPIDELVEEYRPDLIIEGRGYNDLTWLQGRPDEVVAALRAEVELARTVDPDVDVVLTGYPQVWMPNVPETNALLPGLAAGLTQERSRVAVAATGTGFRRGAETWDIAHLSATGEVRYAAAVVDALATLGIGQPYPRPLPAVVDGHWGRATLSVAPGAAPSLRWHRPAGGFQTYVWQRDLSACGPWRRLPTRLEVDTWQPRGLLPGHAYGYRVQSAKGDAVSPEVSNAVTLGRTPPPCAVRGLHVTRGPHRLSVRWREAERATSYRVAWWGARSRTHGSRIVRRPAVSLRGLVTGDRYAVAVTPRSGVGAGPTTRLHARPRR